MKQMTFADTEYAGKRKQTRHVGATTVEALREYSCA